MSEKEYHNDFYSEEASAIFEAPVFEEVRRKRASLLRKLGHLSQKSRVLSLGSGSGEIESMAASHVGEILGIDISPVAVAKARERASTQKLSNLCFEVADVMDLSADQEPFDAIWAGSLIHHIDGNEIDRVLRKCLGLLKPGGRMISVDPNRYRFIGLFKGLFRRQYDLYHSPDERELSPRELEQKYIVAGYCNPEVYKSRFFLDAFAWLFPGTPRWCIPPLVMLDTTLITIPFIKEFASEFFIVAQKPVT